MHIHGMGVHRHIYVHTYMYTYMYTYTYIHTYAHFACLHVPMTEGRSTERRSAATVPPPRSAATVPPPSLCVNCQLGEVTLPKCKAQRQFTNGMLQSEIVAIVSSQFGGQGKVVGYDSMSFGVPFTENICAVWRTARPGAGKVRDAEPDQPVVPRLLSVTNAVPSVHFWATGAPEGCWGKRMSCSAGSLLLLSSFVNPEGHPGQ